MSPDIAASVKARLKHRADARAENLQSAITRFAGERFLYRLGASGQRERCVLKGAALLTLWMDEPYRATQDVDFLAHGPNTEAGVRRIMEDVCAVECPEDGLRFNVGTLRIEPIRATDEYQGQRARMAVTLGKARATLQVDFGFGDVLVTQPRRESDSWDSRTRGNGRFWQRSGGSGGSP